MRNPSILRFTRVNLRHPYYTLVAPNSYHQTSTSEAHDALILPPFIHQCSVLRVIKPTQSYTGTYEVNLGNAGPLTQ